ncbi:hypothetical protein GO491_08920 [Flavobacteriaceae bacterium Ap0902]|nr:hypothetical protein [Flavobacteriaceae bacterium Ap0902]
MTKIIPLGLVIVGVSSCSVSQTATRTNDGIYYDPTEEPVPEVRAEESYNQSASSYESQPIRIGGKYFDEQGNAPEETYENSPIYNDNRVVINTGQDEYYEEDYIEWGDEGGTEVNINNYYGAGFYPPYYSPYYSRLGIWGGTGIGFSFGWNAFYGYPFYPRFYGPAYGYYGWGYPYYGYAPIYNPYYPYYGHGYYGHGYHPNSYLTPVYRGKGNKNGITVGRNSNAVSPSVAQGLRRSDNVLKRVTASNNKRPSTVENNNVIRRSTDKIRVRRVPSNMNQKRGSVGTYSRPRTNNNSVTKPRVIKPRRSTDKVPTYKRPIAPTNNRRTVSPSIRRPSSNFGGSMRTPTRTSRGGIRR